MKSSQKIAIARRSLAAVAHACRAMCACCGWVRGLAVGEAREAHFGISPFFAMHFREKFRWGCSGPGFLPAGWVGVAFDASSLGVPVRFLWYLPVWLGV